MLARGIQLFFTVWFLKFSYQSYTARDYLDLSSDCIFLVLIFAYCHQFATGNVDAGGHTLSSLFSGEKLFWSDVRQIR
jgi:hypothetical protein